MLKIESGQKKLTALKKITMREAGYWERRDIQEMICRSPGAFCEELGEYIHLVGSEVSPSDFVLDRVDLLGVDPDGVTVVIEIKRDSHKLQLLQALSYAGMVARHDPKYFVENLINFNRSYGSKNSQSMEEAREELEDVLEDGDVDGINRTQRIVLLAEQFDFEVLITAEWLSEKHDVDVRCYRIALSSDAAQEYFSCSRVYPPPELTELAIRRRKLRDTGVDETTTWEELLTAYKPCAATAFFRDEIKRGQENNRNRKALMYRVAGKRRFHLSLRDGYVYVWQEGRFKEDQTYWQSMLSSSESIVPVRNGKAISFKLITVEDFSQFVVGVNGDLRAKEFTNSSDLATVPNDLES